MEELRRIYVGRAMAEIDRAMAEMADSHLNALASILCFCQLPSTLQDQYPSG